MKKISILICIIGILLIANILFNNKNISTEKNVQSLAEIILLEEPLSSIIISKNNNKIVLAKNKYCYEIVNLNYCVDNKKLQALRKFLSNDIIDTYKKTEDNLQRLGFKNNKNNSSITINNKSLYFGSINQYNEIYVHYANYIYKIKYNKGILETTSKFWLDKSKPLLSLLETDEFDIEIYNSSTDGINECEIVYHKEIISTAKHSILRNSFFDLYASDAKKTDTLQNSQDLLLIILKNPNSGKKIFKFFLWKEGHLTYFLENYPQENKLKFLIPNSVHENVKSYCK